MEFFKKYVKRIKIFLNRSDLILIDDKDKTNRYKDLTPLEELENANEYIKALEWALNQKNVYNIAITGPYGSGKSSLIKTFVKKHDELKYIKISLANFMAQNVDGYDSQTTKLDEILMKGILKQLFYSVDKKRIPKSRFRKLQVLSFKKVFISTCIISVL